jgi:hypothetical protein
LEQLKKKNFCLLDIKMVFPVVFMLVLGATALWAWSFGVSGRAPQRVIVAVCHLNEQPPPECEKGG